MVRVGLRGVWYHSKEVANAVSLLRDHVRLRLAPLDAPPAEPDEAHI